MMRNMLLSANKSVKLIWTPSHSGISGNELADKEAKLAVQTPFVHIYFENTKKNKK